MRNLLLISILFVIALLFVLNSCTQCHDQGFTSYLDGNPKCMIYYSGTDTISDIYYPQISKPISYPNEFLVFGFPYFYYLNGFQSTTVNIKYKSGIIDTVSISYDRAMKYDNCSNYWMNMTNFILLKNTIDSSHFDPNPVGANQSNLIIYKN